MGSACLAAASSTSVRWLCLSSLGEVSLLPRYRRFVDLVFRHPVVLPRIHKYPPHVVRKSVGRAAGRFAWGDLVWGRSGAGEGGERAGQGWVGGVWGQVGMGWVRVGGWVVGGARGMGT